MKLLKFDFFHFSKNVFLFSHDFLDKRDTLFSREIIDVYKDVRHYINSSCLLLLLLLFLIEVFGPNLGIYTAKDEGNTEPLCVGNDMAKFINTK